MNLKPLLLAALALHPVAANWPDFLPNTRNVAVQADLPLDWAPDKNIVWTSPLAGDGQSSPVVWDRRVVVTSVEGDMKDRNLVVCLDLETGKEIWRRDFDSGLKVKSSLYVSRAAPTPVADADGVVALFESGDLVALDWDGEVRWKRLLTETYGGIEAEFGLAASLAQHGGTVLALIENNGPSYLVAIDKSTGETTWRADRRSVISWSSPAVMTLAGIPQVVVSSVGTVDSYDVATGERLWTIGGLGGNTVATPSQVDESRLIIGAAPGRGEADAEGAAMSNLLIEVKSMPKADDDTSVVTAEVVWRAEKAMASFSSPVAYRGVGYWVNRAGVVFAVDLENGQPLFAQRIDQAPWATAIGVGDRVYFFGKDGTTTVIRAGKTFEKLASNTLWNPDDLRADESAAGREETPERRAAAANFSGPIQYGVAVTGDSLLIRTGNRLYRVAGDSK
ncbi:MAG: pyrrolo-quinoline quinone [Planctomycetaceae bacterium]|nr:MAG: pyrrolo-quinoline quinone [Planctomycetaceae bacterium]